MPSKPVRSGPGSRVTTPSVTSVGTLDARSSPLDQVENFAFVNFGPNGDLALVRWGYTFEEEPDGTRVTESWQVLPAYPDFVSGADETFDVRARIDGMAQMAEDGIKTTLANLKRLAEPEPAGRRRPVGALASPTTRFGCRHRGHSPRHPD